MKQLAWFLLLFHSIILILWVMNSGYLFSLWGVVVWLTSIIVGFSTYKLIKGSDIVKKLILASSYFMFFLVVVTVAIFFTTSSMP